MQSFKLFMEATTPNVYHVTYYRNLPSIAKNGLDYTKYAGSTFEADRIQMHGQANPTLLANSQQGNYFVNHINAVYKWIDTLEINANSKTDDDIDPKKIGLFPVVIRFRLNRIKQQLDAHPETQHDRYTNKIIPPQGLQVWSGDAWLPISDWQQIDAYGSQAPVKSPTADDPDFDDADEYWATKKWK